MPHVVQTTCIRASDTPTRSMKPNIDEKFLSFTTKSGSELLRSDIGNSTDRDKGASPLEKLSPTASSGASSPVECGENTAAVVDPILIDAKKTQHSSADSIDHLQQTFREAAEVVFPLPSSTGGGAVRRPSAVWLKSRSTDDLIDSLDHFHFEFTINDFFLESKDENAIDEALKSYGTSLNPEDWS